MRAGEIGDRRQAVIRDIDQLGGVARLFEGLGDDIGDRVADIAHDPARQDRPGRREHLAAVPPRHLDLGRDLGDPVGVEILDREDAENARRPFRRRGVDRPDAGMGVRRTQHMAIGLAGQVDVVGEAAGAGQEALVLAPLDRLADAIARRSPGISGMLSLPSIEAPYSGVSCRRSLWRCGRGMRAGKAGPVAPVFAAKMQEAGTRLDHGGAALFRRRPEAPFAANAADLQQTAERRVPVHRTVSHAAVARAG